MKKQIFFGSLILGLILLTTGCGQTNATNSTDNNLIGAKSQDTNNGLYRKENQILGSVADLNIGTKIMAMGSTNTDGSMMAKSIIFGSFDGFGPGMSSSTNPNRPRMNGRNGPGGNGGGQRQGGQGRNGGNSMSGSTRINGEIIKKDENSLVVKILDGGSKIVYFSSATEIFSMKPSTNTYGFDISTATSK